MPDQIPCPSCGAKLRVPEAMLGKTVRCPKCQTAFTAGADEPPESEGIATEPAPASRRVPRRDEPDEDDRGEAEDRPRRRRREGQDEDYPDEGRPRRRGRRTAAAAAAVTGPAICLMVVGGLEIALGVVSGILRLVGVGMAAAAGPGQGAPPNNAYLAGQAVGGVVGVIIYFVFGALTLTGGIMMKQLRNYGLAMTGSIIAMLPCSVCCLLGLPFGIWSLVVLNNPEVKEAFR